MNDLAPRSTVRDLVLAFQDAERIVRESFAALISAEQKLNHTFTLGGDLPIRIDASHNGHHDHYDNPDRCIDRMARAAWGVLVERLELRRILSIKRYADLEKQISEGPLPAITEENVSAFARQWAASFEENLTEAVQEVFEWLRPRNSEYKTNSELEIGRKVVLTGMVEHRFSGGFRLRYYRAQHTTALENVFNALDGRGQVTQHYQSDLQTAIEAAMEGKGETRLFRFKVYGNGNLHLEFLRLDLLKKFNMIAGGKRLRPTGT